MRRLTSFLIAIALLAAACGDDSEAGSGSSFCDTANEIDAVTDDLDTADDFREFARLVSEAQASAPAEISAAVDTTADFLDEMVAALDANDDNVILAFDELQASGDTDAYQAAGEEIAQYTSQECGIEDSDDDDDGSDDGQFDDGVVAGLAEQLGVTEDQARCLVAELDVSAGERPETAAVLGALDACDIDPLSIATDG